MRNVHTKEERASIVNLLILHDWKYNKVSKLSGVKVRRLRLWAAKAGYVKESGLYEVETSQEIEEIKEIETSPSGMTYSEMIVPLPQEVNVIRQYSQKIAQRLEDEINNIFDDKTLAVARSLAPYKDRIQAAAILTDKVQLLRGESTSREEVITRDATRTLDAKVLNAVGRTVRRKLESGTDGE